MRLLMTWLQIHPAIGEAGRIQVGAAQAVDAENFDAGRRFDPDTDLDRESLDARMAADPPTSVSDFLELIAAELQAVTGFHVTPQIMRPVPPQEPAPEPAVVDEPPPAPPEG